MLIVRHANQRGHANHGWLDSHHSFSFASYYDPAYMGFRNLRVINEDRVQPARALAPSAPRHGDRVVRARRWLAAPRLAGHRLGDSPGDVQRMSAGTGVTHSEFNASKSESVHFLQIWLQPSQPGLAPSYEQKTFSDAEKRGRLRLVASPQPREGNLTIHSDAHLYAGRFAAGEGAEHPGARSPRLGAGRPAAASA